MGLFNKNKATVVSGCACLPVEHGIGTVSRYCDRDDCRNSHLRPVEPEPYHGSEAHLEQLDEARTSNDHQLAVERANSQGLFLLELRQTGNVSRACSAAGIARVTAYAWKANDEGAKGDEGDGGDGFSAKWNEVHNAYVDGLEQEVDRRAFVGYDQPVVYQGELQYETDGEGNKTLVTVKKFSDSLVGLRLKALRPDKYRELRETHHTGGTDSTLTQRVIFTMPDNGRD